MATDQIAIRRAEPIINLETGAGTLRFLEYIEGSTRQLNTITNTTAETQTQLSQGQQNSARIVELERKVNRMVIEDEDYSANISDIVICNNSSQITVLAPEDPLVGDEFYVKRTNAAVLVESVGSVKFDGEVDRFFNTIYWGERYVFTGIEWSVL